MKFRSIIRRLAPVYIFILFVIAVIPLGSRAQFINDSYTFHIRWDYLIHVLISLPMFLMIGFRIRNKGRYWVRVIAIALIITVLLEAIQLMIPYRAFNINDLLASALGLFIGLAPAVLLWRRFSCAGQCSLEP